ncbi:hypothetical protein SAMN05660916_01518 [Arthrobacter sp. 31Cvi3.1E]|uniref:hypothetical protein n=1 Tax=Paenarthrobacter nicotinovorans TaxID=29320 RepID=UPI0009CF6885|nr:hypothetical protein SAMN05660916_01518 [Arthrobacter sp. 31Cvi3.1E]
MKKRRPAAPAPNESETARTGHHCPQAGWWSVGHEAAPMFIAEGQVMPAVGGVPAVWILREAAGRGRFVATSLRAAF